MPEGPKELLQATFRATAAAGRAALLPYLTAGLPTVAESVALFEAMAEGGADGFEVGIPYSDPLMDGPVIHGAGLRALTGGATIERSLEIVAGAGKATGLPTMVMTYVNPVMRYGPDRFAAMAAEAGAAAMILADLPAEEADPFRRAFDGAGLGTVLFVAPTTGEGRLRSVVAQDPIFLYGIAELGVTGERTMTSNRAAELAQRVRAVTDAPLVLGVGISTPGQARVAASLADGVIVGSALVRRVLDAPSAVEAAAALRIAVRDLAAAMRREAGADS